MRIEARIERIVNLLLRGAIVPFVGAGISVGAKLPSEPGYEPSIQHMTQLLTRRLLCDLRDRKRGSKKRTLALGALPGIRKAGFGHIAEVAQGLFGLNEVCDTIGIPKLSKLEPQPAHYALACLALEGLIEEIISTNWDCCIEAATEQLTHIERNADDGELGVIRVITDLSSYRSYGAGRRTALGGTILKLFKINGCALIYSRYRDEKHAEDIILTERQLQDFGSRRWAYEMLKDRARARTLLFSGFGSEEPQVRHTVLQLLREFSTGDNQPDGHSLFMISYARDLSFTQLQIVRAFCKASKTAVHTNVVTGRDSEFFGLKEPFLSASALWCALLDLALYRLISRRYTKPGSIFYSWLRLLSPRPSALRVRWLTWLFPRQLGSQSSLRCSIPGLFGPSSTEPGFILGGWLRAMGWRPAKSPSGDSVPVYYPLQKEQILPLATLFTIFLLACRTKQGGNASFEPIPMQDFVRDYVTAINGVGVRVRVPIKTNGSDTTLSREPFREIFLVTGNAPERAYLWRGKGSTSRSRICCEIAVPKRLSVRPPPRAIEIVDRMIRVRRRRQVNSEQIIKYLPWRDVSSLLSIFCRETDLARIRARLVKLQ